MATGSGLRLEHQQAEVDEVMRGGPAGHDRERRRGGGAVGRPVMITAARRSALEALHGEVQSLPASASPRAANVDAQAGVLLTEPGVSASGRPLSRSRPGARPSSWRWKERTSADAATSSEVRRSPDASGRPASATGGQERLVGRPAVTTAARPLAGLSAASVKLKSAAANVWSVSSLVVTDPLTATGGSVDRGAPQRRWSCRLAEARRRPMVLEPEPRLVLMLMMVALSSGRQEASPLPSARASRKRRRRRAASERLSLNRLRRRCGLGADDGDALNGTRVDVGDVVEPAAGDQRADAVTGRVGAVLGDVGEGRVVRRR